MKRTILSALLTIGMFFLGAFSIYVLSHPTYGEYLFDFSLFTTFFLYFLIPVALMFYITFFTAINTSKIRMNNNFILSLDSDKTFSKVSLFTKSFYLITGWFTLLLSLSFAVTIIILTLYRINLSIIHSTIWNIFIIYSSLSCILNVLILISTKLELNNTQQEIDLMMLKQFGMNADSIPSDQD